MKRYKQLIAAIPLFVALVIAGCSSDDAATPTPQPMATPASDSTQARPTPTALAVGVDPQLASLTAVVRAFGTQLAAVEDAWTAFDDGFNTWRHSLAGCSPNDRAADLDGWVTDFRAVIDTMTAVSFPSGTSEARVTLADALRAEEAGLRSQTSLWATDGGAAFAAYDSARTEAAILRQALFASLAEAITTGEAEAAAGTPPTVNAVAIGDVQAALEAASDDWARFHTAYDAWRTGNGTCNDAAVASALQQSVTDFAVIANQANALVRPSIVRPFAEQFITAAATQANALDTLEASWEPYQASAWDAYDALANNSALARRQVRSSLDELNFQYALN